ILLWGIVYLTQAANLRIFLLGDLFDGTLRANYSGAKGKRCAEALCGLRPPNVYNSHWADLSYRAMGYTDNVTRTAYGMRGVELQQLWKHYPNQFGLAGLERPSYAAKRQAANMDCYTARLGLSTNGRREAGVIDRSCSDGDTHLARHGRG